MQHLDPSVPISTTRIPVVICDDQVMMREGLASWLAREGFEVVHATNTLSDVREVLTVHPDAVLLSDLGIDELPLPAFLAQLRDVIPGNRVVIYSMREGAEIMAMVYQAGVAAFIPKSSAPQELYNALRSAAAGQRYISPTIATKLTNSFIEARSPLKVLNKRELDLFMLFAQGMSIDEIAKRKGRTAQRVNSSVSEIRRKLDVEREAFHRIAIQYGLLDPLMGATQPRRR